MKKTAKQKTKMDLLLAYLSRRKTPVTRTQASQAISSREDDRTIFRHLNRLTKSGLAENVSDTRVAKYALVRNDQATPMMN